MELKTGKTFKVKHSRKGVFWLQVTDVSEEWVDCVLVAGNPKMMNPDNEIFEGEKMTVRKSFLTVLEEAPALPIAI